MIRKSRTIRERQTGRIIGRIEFTQPTSPPSPRAPVLLKIGLGDLVELGAKPVARQIDRLTARLPWRKLRTKLAGCSACSRRRAWLNHLMPDIRRPWRLKWPGWPRV